MADQGARTIARLLHCRQAGPTGRSWRASGRTRFDASAVASVVNRNSIIGERSLDDARRVVKVDRSWCVGHGMRHGHSWGLRPATRRPAAGDRQSRTTASAARGATRRSRRSSAQALGLPSGFPPGPAASSTTFPADVSGPVHPPGRVAKTGAASSAPGASSGSATPWRTNTTSTLPEPLALEQLAAFSLLARWIEECDVEVTNTARVTL